MKGRTRIEVSVDEAAVTLAWAATLDGWAEADPKPLFAYPHDYGV